jgi:hypothetical protein
VLHGYIISSTGIFLTGTPPTSSLSLSLGYTGTPPTSSMSLSLGYTGTPPTSPKKPGTPRSSTGSSPRQYTGAQQPHIARRPVVAKGCVGPGSYKQSPSIGRQAQSQRATTASFSFGSPRPKTSKKRTQRGYKEPDRGLNKVGEARFNPGPGAYPVPSSIGIQTLSLVSTAPSSSFAKSALGAGSKIYMPGFSEIENEGQMSPGPCIYSPTHNFAKPSGPSYSMRWRDKELSPEKRLEKDNAVPGPGNYKSQVARALSYLA